MKTNHQRTLFDMGYMPALKPYISDWGTLWCEGIVAHPVNCDYVVTPGGHVEIFGDGWKIITDRLRDGSLWRKFEIEGEVFTEKTKMTYTEEQALTVELDCNWGIPEDELPSQLKQALGGRYVFRVPW